MKLLVCDLDNTLYDWIGYFVPAFYGMVDVAVQTSGCNRETLLDQMREIHRANADSEHPYTLLEAPVILERFPGRTKRELAHIFSGALAEFESVRRERLKLFPGVITTLRQLEDAGVILVAHTESRMHAIADRLSFLKIDKYFRRIYCRERARYDHPSGLPTHSAVGKSIERRFRELSHHQRKPDPTVLEEICRDQRVLVSETAYVGDSLTKDVHLANTVGAFAIWAKYGSGASSELYEKLVRVSHWSEEDIQRERELRSLRDVAAADLVLTNSFSELLPTFGLSGSRVSEREEWK